MTSYVAATASRPLGVFYVADGFTRRLGWCRGWCYEYQRVCAEQCDHEPDECSVE